MFEITLDEWEAGGLAHVVHDVIHWLCKMLVHSIVL